MAAYIPKVVRIEFGARSDHEPALETEVRSFVAEEFAEAFTAPSARVRILAPERTFWEKATILHAENHRPMPEGTSNPRQWTRLSRHVYDIFMMAERSAADRALERMDLLQQVADHKSVFFHAAWARYDLARPGSFALVPRGAFREALRNDYRSMGEMFPGEPPSFDEVLDALANLEVRINDSGSA